jgi:hypothetical protein
MKKPLITLGCIFAHGGVPLVTDAKSTIRSIDRLVATGRGGRCPPTR